MQTVQLQANQRVNTSYYYKWESGAFQYFDTLGEAIDEAAKMYTRTTAMSDENYLYWLKQTGIVGIRTTIHTDIFETRN